MKIALISFHSFYHPGGVKRHVLGLFKEFKKRGIDCKIIAPRRERKENYGKDVILLGTSFPLPFAGAMSDLGINFNPLSIERVLRKEKFDVLHFHNFGFPSTLQILASPATSDALNVLTFHANIEKSKFLKRFSFLMSLLNKICQWKIDGIIGVAALNLKRFKNYSGPKIVIPNGIDLEEFNPGVDPVRSSERTLRNSLNKGEAAFRLYPTYHHERGEASNGVEKFKKFPDDKINILFLGRIEKRKGLIYLLKAYKILQKKFSNLRLIVGGDGPLKGDLENWVLKNKLKDVIFEGKVEEQKASSYYAGCDIFCSPAIFGESFGLVLIEAMACGKPVVAFANTGYREVLKGRGKRFLAKPRDYETLAKKLEILIKSENLRKEMGRWGIEEAKKYSWSTVANQILDFYQFCRKEKQKKEKSFSLEKQVNKVFNEIFNSFYPIVKI